MTTIHQVYNAMPLMVYIYIIYISTIACTMRVLKRHTQCPASYSHTPYTHALVHNKRITINRFDADND